MSLDYDLRITTDLHPQLILELLSPEVGLQWGKEGNLLNGGTTVGALLERELSQLMMDDNFGFKPTIDIWFRIHKSTFEEQSLGKQTLLMACALLLNKIPGDAVLLFNYEKTVFQRIGGILVFNKHSPPWQESELAEVKLPDYYFAALRSPLQDDKSPSCEIPNSTYTRLETLAIYRGKEVAELINDSLDFYINQQTAKIKISEY